MEFPSSLNRPCHFSSLPMYREKWNRRASPSEARLDLTFSSMFHLQTRLTFRIRGFWPEAGLGHFWLRARAHLKIDAIFRQNFFPPSSHTISSPLSLNLTIRPPIFSTFSTPYRVFNLDAIIFADHFYRCRCRRLF